MKIEIDFINQKVSVEDKDALASTLEKILEDIVRKYFPEKWYIKTPNE